MIRAYIQDILTEWALRSDDGLALGYSTHENMDVLNTILKERGISEDVRTELLSSVLSNSSGG